MDNFKENCTWDKPLKGHYHYKYHDGNALQNIDLNDCKATCMQVSTCWSINYHAVARSCKIHIGETTIKKPEYLINWDLYNLRCNEGKVQ